ncbi:MAG TPA: efflux RND transporter periplasmic adaptor subunit [Novosphingobium sp.]|nr:efflux RND transporter periplasmic adaptor subunit [Novosphingobium sp.]
MTDLPAPTHSPSGPQLNRRQQIRLAGAAVVASLLVFGAAPRLWSLMAPPPAAPAPAPADGSFAATDRQWQTLRFETLRSQTWQNGVVTDGKIAVDDDRTTQVLSPFTGRVTRVFAKVGDRVRAGDPLFAVIANEAAQNDADMLTGVATLKAAEAEAARMRDLSRHQGAAEKDLEAAEVNLASARAALNAAEARRLALGGSLSRGEGVVRAPVAGIVTQRLIGLGQNVASASGGAATQAFTISDFGQVWVVGNLREEDAAKAHVGQLAEVRLLVDPDHPLAARVDYVASALDPASRRLTVRASLANAGGQLKPEMFASFRLLTGGARTVLTAPEAAVIYEGATARVWVAQPSGHRLALRAIGTGATFDGRVEITAGLQAGETVVTAGSLFIDRGAKAD